jgi:hypothetical protein
MRLVYDFIPSNENILPDLEEKSHLLEKKSSCMITLSMTPKAPVKIIIKGIEVGLYKIATFKHSFYKKNSSSLYSEREKRKSLRKNSLSNNIATVPKTIEITYDII